MQLTVALMLAGAIQASQVGRTGRQRLQPVMEDWIVSAYEELRASGAPVQYQETPAGDPRA
jgi:hypothetical protein